MVRDRSGGITGSIVDERTLELTRWGDTTTVFVEGYGQASTATDTYGRFVLRPMPVTASQFSSNRAKGAICPEK